MAPHPQRPRRSIITKRIGEAAFYGPKLDIQIKNVHGKEDTLITIQIDFRCSPKNSGWNTSTVTEQAKEPLYHPPHLDRLL